MGALIDKIKSWFGGEEKPAEPAEEPKIEYVPESLEDFVGIIKRTPSDILSVYDKKQLKAVMSFADKEVRSAMTPAKDAPVVFETDFLGPLMLDKLYKSGFLNFPVIDKQKHIIGVLSTKKLNSLEIKKTDRAKEYVEKDVCYVRPDYLLSEALAASLRTGESLMVVIDKEGVFMGVITLEQILGQLMGQVPKDDFVNDSSSVSVAKRQFDM